ncbi:hypothetical protein ACFLXG_03105 [Chloroflexota bacterium]
MTKTNAPLTLKEAINLYRLEERAFSNSYNWFRKEAQRDGSIGIAGKNILVTKYKGVWYVNRKDFSEAINQHRESIKHLKQMTEDLRKGIIHGTNGDTIRTGFGGYEIHGDFRFVWDDVQRYRRKSYGTWYCNRCQAPAETEYNKKECHLCSDWNGCGEDCTLSRVCCPKCGTSINF